MPPRSYSSLLGVLCGFFCIFPLLMKREEKAAVLTSAALLQLAQEQMREAQEAKAAGNEPLYQKLIDARNALRDSARNAALWKT